MKRCAITVEERLATLEQLRRTEAGDREMLAKLRAALKAVGR